MPQARCGLSNRPPILPPHEWSGRPIRLRRDEPYRAGVLSGFGGSSGVTGTAEPVFETRLAQERVIARNKCALAYLCAEVLRLRVSDNLARIVACSEGDRKSVV